MNRTARIAAGVVLVVIGIAALLYYTAGSGKSTTYEHEVTLGDQLWEIRIDGDDLSLNVRFVTSASGNNTVRIEGKASDEIVKRIRSAKVENGVLDLKFTEEREWEWSFFPFRSGNGEQTLTFELTEEALAELETFRASVDSGTLRVSGAAARASAFASGSGSIRIDSLRGGDATVQSDSGSIRLERFEGDSLSLRSDSGSIHAGTVNAALIAASDSGSIRVEHLNGYGETTTDSGSVHIVKADDTGLTVTSDSGSVRIEVPASYSGTYDLASRSGAITRPESAGTSGAIIRVRTDSGSIRIEQ